MVAETALGVSRRRLYLARMTDCGSEAVTAAFRSVGLDAVVLPPPDAASLALGSRYLSGDECLPAKVTLGDYLKVVFGPGFDPRRSAFVMPTTEGPCRFGQYAPAIRQILRELGVPEVVVVSPTSGDGYDFGAYGPELQRTIWRAVVASDILRKLLLKTRPYETDPGVSDATYRRSLDELVATLETPGLRTRAQLRALEADLVRIRDRFRAIPARYDTGRLLIGIQGEIFCRMEEFCNDQLIRRLEAGGAEAWLADIAEWVWYCNVYQEDMLRQTGRRLSLAMLQARLRDRIQHADEAALRAPFMEDFTGYEDPEPVREILAAGAPYLPHPGASGEMVLSAGTVDWFFRKGADGIIDISPFSCMNGLVSEALYPRQSQEHDGLPIRVFYFDGTARDLTLDLEIFLEMAQGYQQRKPHPRRYPPWFA